MKLNEFSTKASFETAGEPLSICLTGDALSFVVQTSSNSKPRVILSLENIR